MEKRHWKTMVASPTAKSANTHVVPSRTLHVNVILASAMSCDNSLSPLSLRCL